VLRESIGATAIAFSPDARWILSGGNDGITRLWLSASQNANPERAFWGGYRKILAVRFSSDGRSILSASADGKLGVWDRSSGKKVRDIETNVNVSTLSFSSDGRLALWAEWNSGSHGNRGYRIQLKEVATGRELGVFQGIGSGEAISSIAVSRDGRWLGAQQVQDKTTQLWDCHKGCSLRKIPQHGGDTTTITFSPDSRRILLGTTNGDLRLIDTDNGKTIDNFTGHSNEITGAKFSFDGSLLLSGDSAGNVHLWDIESGQQLYSLNAKNRIRAVAFSPDGHWGLSWDSSGLLHMLPINGRTVNEQPSARLLGIIGFAVAISPDARFAVTNELGNCEMIGFDSVCNKKLALWETSTGNIIQTWEVGFVKDELLSLNAIIAADFSPDGKQIVSGSMDGTLHLLNVGDAQKATIIGIHTGGIRTVTFSANGHSILSGGHDGTIRLWQPQTGRELVEYVALNATEWVAITSHGYFNALPQGLKHINARRGTEIYGADRFSAKFHRPDIIEEVLRSGGTNEPAIADEGWKDNTTYLITGQSYGQNFKDAPVCPGRAETIVTRRWSAWLLGSGLRTAVFNNASSPIGSENGVDIPFQSVRTLAEDFHVSLPALPKSSGERVKDLANAIIYLDNASKLIEEGLSDDDTYTPDYRALFRFSSHFGLMLLMYDPHGDPDYTTTVLGIIDTLKELGEEMRLPRDLWIKPVILMEQGNPPQSVHEALAVTDRRVNEYFESLYSRSK
jgi:WD40 repeat protein